MLTAERRAALEAVQAGTVHLRPAPGQGAHTHLTTVPKEYTVAVGFLRRAQLVDVKHGDGRLDLTDTGRLALASV